jgi:hypothetical protein
METQLVRLEGVLFFSGRTGITAESSVESRHDLYCVG